MFRVWENGCDIVPRPLLIDPRLERQVTSDPLLLCPTPPAGDGRRSLTTDETCVVRLGGTDRTLVQRDGSDLLLFLLPFPFVIGPWSI